MSFSTVSRDCSITSSGSNSSDEISSSPEISELSSPGSVILSAAATSSESDLISVFSEFVSSICLLSEGSSKELPSGEPSSSESSSIEASETCSDNATF